MKIIKYNDIKTTSVKIAIAGEGGVGKTFWAIAHKLKTLLLCTEAYHAKIAIDTAVKMGLRDPNTLDVIACKSIADFRDGLQYAIDHQAEYDLLVVDNFSGVRELAVPEVEGKVEEKRKKSKSGSEDKFAYFAFMGSTVTPLVHKIRDISCDVVAILHTKESKDSNGKVIGIRLDIDGNVIKNAIRRSFSVRGYMTKELVASAQGQVIKRPIIFEQGGDYLNFITGHPALSVKEENNLVTLINKIKGEK